MMHGSIDVSGRVEGIARYLGSTYPTLGIERYEDGSRGVVGFRFIGSPHANVEFEETIITALPADENGVAQEMHLMHVASEINTTPASQRVVFAVSGIRRE